MAAEGRPSAEFDGETDAQERWLRADLAFVRTWMGDTEGDLISRTTARTFNPSMAAAAKVTVAEVQEIVEAGTLDPDSTGETRSGWRQNIMAFFTCNKIVLHAEVIGGADKAALVLSNSLGTDARIWNAVVPLLSDRYRIVRYDKRGHGLSDAPRGSYRIADHAADLLALLDQLAIERFALVGLSVGGMIAQTVATDHPARVPALVLCDTAAKIGDAATWDARIEAVEDKGIESIATSVLERWFTLDYRTRETAATTGWRNMLTRQPPGGYAATCAAIRDADLRDKARTIAVPTLCLVGDQDLSTPPDLVRGTADLIPNSRFVTVAGAGHIPCVEQPRILADLVRGHLAEAGWR